MTTKSLLINVAVFLAGAVAGGTVVSVYTNKKRKIESEETMDISSDQSTIIDSVHDTPASNHSDEEGTTNDPKEIDDKILDEERLKKLYTELSETYIEDIPDEGNPSEAPDLPYLISAERFNNEHEEYEKFWVDYHQSTGELRDHNDGSIFAGISAEHLLGEEFFEEMGDSGVLYVRNPMAKIDFSINIIEESDDE